MSTNFLDQADIDTFADLLLRSRQAESTTRETLCRKIGIDPKRVGFVNQSGDYYFALELINYLHEIDDRQALCQLCNELYVVFNKGQFASLLMEIAAKINCDLSLTQNSSKRTVEHLNFQPVGFVPESESNFNPPREVNELQSQSWLRKLKNIKYKLLIGGVVLLTGLVGFQIYSSTIKFSDPRYAQLEDLLAQGKWQEADRETADQMWQMAGKWQERTLRAEDFEKLSCDDLRSIDNLWTKYSKQHFGFSAQRSVWQSSEVNSQLIPFMNRVGWAREEERDNKKFILFLRVDNFSLSAPKGQLPWLVTWEGSDGMRDRTAYITKIVTCGI